MQQISKGILNFFQKRVGLRGKIMGMALFLIITFGFSSSLQIYHATSDALETYLEMTGVSIAKAVAARSEDYILTNNLYQLHTLVFDTMESNPDVRYMFILGTDQQVITSSFSLSLPEGLRDINQFDGDNEYSLQTISTEEGLIDDIAVPVLGGRAGTVRIGVSRQGIQAIVWEMIRQMGLLTLFVSLLGLVVVFVLTKLILSPIFEMVAATQEVGQGDFTTKLRPSSKDEIGKLMTAFNHMTDRLNELQQSSLNYKEELERKEILRLQLQEKIITSQEEERKRISRELHDETGQSLTSLKLVLKRIEEGESLEETKEIVSSMREILTDALEKVRALAWELRPSVLDDMGLVVSLERYLEECSHRLGINIDYQSFGLKDWHPVGSLEITIYRVVQEAVTNIAKHADAKNASVVLEKQGKYIIAVIEDDGQGFDTDTLEGTICKSPSLGLFGMQERAHLVGGELIIESAEGVGTTIYLKIPLEEEKGNLEKD